MALVASSAFLDNEISDTEPKSRATHPDDNQETIRDFRSSLTGDGEKHIQTPLGKV